MKIEKWFLSRKGKGKRCLPMALSSYSAQRLEGVSVTYRYTTYKSVEKSIDARIFFAITVHDDGRSSFSLYKRKKGWYDSDPVQFIGVNPVHHPWIAELPCSEALKEKLYISINPGFTKYTWRDAKDGQLECWFKIVDGKIQKTWDRRNGTPLDLNKLNPNEAELYAIPHEAFVYRWIWG